MIVYGVRSVETLLAVFALLLREAKLLFVCKSNTLLTEAMETLRGLLFPLTWSSCFVSRLPDALMGMLQAPGPSSSPFILASSKSLSPSSHYLVLFFSPLTFTFFTFCHLFSPFPLSLAVSLLIIMHPLAFS